MSAYLIPTDEATIEEIAKSIARARLLRDAEIALENLIGAKVNITDRLEESIDRILGVLWTGGTELDENQKDGYRSDALAAIRTINMKLMSSPM